MMEMYIKVKFSIYTTKMFGGDHQSGPQDDAVPADGS